MLAQTMLRIGREHLGFAELAQTMLRIGREHLGFAELAQTMPCAIIALATFMKPATLAPLT